ncbi:hypothetical protein O4H52_03015 [Sphingomonadaceae bacterium G21617-S1]|nr:hypothetical protein [Sphingomonadaceae bacterium G21617-S1]
MAILSGRRSRHRSFVSYNGPDAGQIDEDGHRAPPAVCHSFVRNGQIEFLSDCTHALAGQTVPLPPFP